MCRNITHKSMYCAKNNNKNGIVIFKRKAYICGKGKKKDMHCFAVIESE